MEGNPDIARLQHLGSDAAELDRVCAEVADSLIRTVELPTFQLTSVDFTSDAFSRCADHYWRRRFEDAPSVHTAIACARWLQKHAAVTDESGRPLRAEIEEKWALSYASETNHWEDSPYELSSVLVELGGSRDLAHFAAMYCAGKLYASHKFKQLHDFLEFSRLAQAAGDLRSSPMTTALRAFAAFSDSRITEEYARDLLDTSWYSPHLTVHSAGVCLRALAVASRFDGHGALLRDRASAAVAQWPEQHIFAYRLAQGHRLCGEYDEALEAMDLSLALLDSNGSPSALSESSRESREKYLEWQERCREQRNLTRERHLAAMDEDWDRRQEGKLEEARKKASRRGEVFAFYGLSSLVFFAVAFVTLAPGPPADPTIGERFVLLAGYGAALIIFSCTLLYLALRIRRHEQKRWKC